MKALLVAGAAAAILFAPVVGAQNRGFEGFSLGLNVNSASISNDFTANNLPRNIEQTSPNTSFQTIFGLPAHGTFNFGIGMTYALSELKAGAVTVGGVNHAFIEHAGRNPTGHRVNPRR